MLGHGGNEPARQVVRALVGAQIQINWNHQLRAGYQKVVQGSHAQGVDVDVHAAIDPQVTVAEQIRLVCTGHNLLVRGYYRAFKMRLNELLPLRGIHQHECVVRIVRFPRVHDGLKLGIQLLVLPRLHDPFRNPGLILLLILILILNAFNAAVKFMFGHAQQVGPFQCNRVHHFVRQFFKHDWLVRAQVNLHHRFEFVDGVVFSANDDRRKG